MANDLNQCQFIGRLGADPEIRYMSNGEPVVTLSIAVGSAWKDKATGEKKEHTEWVRCDAFGRTGEVIAQYLRKGSRVYLQGSWRTRKWTDQGGTDHYSTSLRISNMQMLDAAPASGQPQSGQPPAPTAATPAATTQYASPAQAGRAVPQQRPAQQPAGMPPAPPGFDAFDDDIPF